MPDTHFSGDNLCYGTKDGSANIEDEILLVGPEIVTDPISKDENDRERHIAAPTEDGKKYDEPEERQIPDEG